MLALPVLALAVFALARWRTWGGTAPGTALRRSLSEVGAIAGTLPWLWMVLTPTSGARGVSLIPLQDLVALLDARVATVVVQVGGNLLVLAAFGAFVPVRFAALARLHRVAAASAGVSATIELLQYVLDLGRVSSVDDVLMNTAGATIAALLTRRWWAK
ncbi:VanZ family protein [Saccharopolyspora sp. NPDC003752]